MAPERRCEWTSASLLLDRDSRGEYEHLNCDERVAANERLWWVTTPLFSDSVDDRRSEHFARKVLVQLHSALPWDERYDWRGYHGGQAVEEMLLRYGWPAFSAFAGAEEERDHAGWMNFYDSTRTATAEYPQDRLHLVPKWRAVSDPFHATPDTWDINMPSLSNDDEPAAQWWPTEHYGRAAGGIVQLSDQTVILRRDNDVVLATASAARRHAFASRAVSGRRSRSFDGTHQVERVPHQTYLNETSLVLTGRIPVKPAIVGRRCPPRSAEISPARTRSGVVPPARSPRSDRARPPSRILSSSPRATRCQRAPSRHSGRCSDPRAFAGRSWASTGSRTDSPRAIEEPGQRSCLRTCV